MKSLTDIKERQNHTEYNKTTDLTSNFNINIQVV